jgi:hypothetical protein
VTPYFSFGTNFRAPAKNPAGTQWAFFYSADPGAQDPQWDVYVDSSLNATGASRRTFQSFDAPSTLQYTGDGAVIVFTAGQFIPNPDPKLGRYEYGIYRVNASGGTTTRIMSARDFDWAHVHPVTNKIVAADITTGPDQIATMNLDGTGFLTVTTGGFINVMPQWSKAGDKIVFSSDRDNPNFFDIFTCNANGTGLLQLTDNTLSEFGPSFSADDSMVAFSQIGSGTGIYRVNANGTNRILLRSEPSVSPAIYWTFSGGFDSFDGGGLGVAGDWYGRKRR